MCARHRTDYLQASRLARTSASLQEWERFRLAASGKNLYALQTLAISPPVYLSAGADGTVRTEAQAISAAEEFDLVPLPKGHVALRTHTGTYLGAVNGGGGEVRCDFKDISPETTLLIRVMVRASLPYYAHTHSYAQAPCVSKQHQQHAVCS